MPWDIQLTWKGSSLPFVGNCMSEKLTRKNFLQEEIIKKKKKVIKEIISIILIRLKSYFFFQGCSNEHSFCVLEQKSQMQRLYAKCRLMMITKSWALEKHKLET